MSRWAEALVVGACNGVVVAAVFIAAKLGGVL